MSLDDKYEGYATGQTGPIIGGFDVTPNDGADLATVTRAIMVTTAGDVAVVLKDGSALTLPGLVPGHFHAFRVVRVLATGTTATGIKGLY